MLKHASLYAPRNWPVWLTFGLLRIIMLMPFSAILSFGRVLGRLLKKIVGRLVHIAQTNLAHCFPDLTTTG